MIEYIGDAKTVAQLAEIAERNFRNISSSASSMAGYVNSTGAVVSGSGFTSSHLSTGGYQVTFDTAFASTPVVVASLTAVALAYEIVVSSVTTANFVVRTFDAADALADAGFSFIVTGV